jgi:predicted TIM-barrel fold metal-dependent hydrolase
MGEGESITAIRERLDHPIIDADAHVLEAFPLFLDELRGLLGPVAEDDFRRSRYHAMYSGLDTWASMSDMERRAVWLPSPTWWGTPTNAADRVAAYVPEKLVQRLSDIGIDHAIVYPSVGLMLPRIPEAELRQSSCRALNTYLAREFAPHGDRVTIVATIPTVTPAEAIDELEYIVGTLDLKAIMIDSSVDRVVPAFANHLDELGTRVCRWDTYGIDSEYDYDPFWARCSELGLAVTAHGGSRGTTLHQSVSSFSYNHMEHFAAAGLALAKSLVLGGVTRRFPQLNFACLEGGAAWGVSLAHSLVEHWEVRGRPGINRIDPRGIDSAAVERVLSTVDDTRWQDPRLRDVVRCADDRGPAQRDDFAACRAASVADVRELFGPRFWFGCEADDPGAAWALQNGLHAMFGSDIGHFDVPDMASVVPSAWSLVTTGLLDEEQFHEYVFSNVVRLHGAMNPRFFEGTAVANAAACLLASEPSLEAPR